jgi:hypothetical protein
MLLKLKPGGRRGRRKGSSRIRRHPGGRTDRPRRRGRPFQHRLRRRRHKRRRQGGNVTQLSQIVTDGGAIS